MLFGATLITLALLPANYANLALLMVLRFLAGTGENLVNLPAQTLIADRVPIGVQGRVLWRTLCLESSVVGNLLPSSWMARKLF